MQFSYDEMAVLKVIGRRKRKIHDVAWDFNVIYRKFGVSVEQNYVAGVIRRIQKKCEKEKSTWTILGKGVGRGGKTVWRGKRKSRSN